MVEFNINQESSKGEYSLTEASKNFDFVVLLFQRDFYCTNCRTQIQDVEERYDEFIELDTQVVSVLPENLSRANEWDDKYDLSYPVVADKSKDISQSPTAEAVGLSVDIQSFDQNRAPSLERSRMDRTPDIKAS